MLKKLGLVAAAVVVGMCAAAAAEPRRQDGLVVQDGFIVADRSSQQALDRVKAGLVLLADPAIIDDPEVTHLFVRLFPVDRIRAYIDPSVTRTGRDLADALESYGFGPRDWRGDDPFQKEDARKAFAAAFRDELLALRPALPLKVMRVAAFSPPYDKVTAEWPLRDSDSAVDWVRSGERSGGLDDGEGAGVKLPTIEVVQPFDYPATLSIGAEDGRRLFELARQEAQKAGGFNAAGRPRAAPFVVVTRYAITNVVKRGKDIVAETATVDLSLRPRLNLTTVIRPIPLPDAAILFSGANDAASASAPSGTPLFSEEWPRLMMIKKEPKLAAANDTFLVETFRVRREMEAGWRRSCADRKCPELDGGRLIPPSLVARSYDQPTTTDLARFSEAEKSRADALGDRVRVALCSDCGAAPSGAVDPIALFRPVHEDEGLPLARALAPDATGVRGAASGRDVATFVALVPSEHWEGVAAPATAKDVSIEFAVRGANFIRDQRQALNFVVALEPVAIAYSDGGQPTRRELGASAPAPAAAGGTGSAPAPSAKAEVLGVRLGMPIDEAIATIAGQYQDLKTTQSTSAAPASFSSITPCEMTAMRAEQDRQARLSAIEAEARSAGREPRAEDRKRVEAESTAALDKALDAGDCPNGSKSPVVFAWSLTVDHGEGATETIQLYRTGGRFGPPVVSLIHRSVAQSLQPAFVEALKAKYGEPSVINGQNLYWIESPAYRSAFGQDGKGRCLTFWPSGSLPDVKPNNPCGAFIRAQFNEMYLVDTRFVAAASNAASQMKAVEEASREKPKIKF